MKIGIDARLYTQTGVGRYLRNLITELGVLDHENEYIVYLRYKEYPIFDLPGKNWKKILLDIPWHTLKEQFSVPLLLAKDRLDVAHFPYFNVPIFYPGKYLLTIHDLIVDHFDTGRASTLPAPLYKLKRLAYHTAMSRGIRRASAITIISETTKQEVIDHYRVDPSRLVVTYDALDSGFREIVRTYRPKKRYPFKYLLYVGNAYPHKNLERLLGAFVLVRKKMDIHLVLAGDDEYFYPRLAEKAKTQGLGESVIFFGNANDRELIDLYSHASCLVFPSLMEGFGLPTFESLACGCLSIISDIPVFREIWENDLPIFHPDDPGNMANVILNSIQLSRDERQKKIHAAARRIDDFSWKETAKETLKIYERIYKSN